MEFTKAQFDESPRLFSSGYSQLLDFRLPQVKALDFFHTAERKVMQLSTL
jgi:hypothetical protein